MMTSDWNREEWLERMVCALAPLVQTATVAPYGVDPLSNDQYRGLAEQAKTDKHAKMYFDDLLPTLNEDSSALIALLCRHPGIAPNIGGTGKDLATFVVMPSGGFLIQFSILTRYLIKSAMLHGCTVAVGQLEKFLSLSAQNRVPGYEVWIFRGLTMSAEFEIIPGLELMDYQRAVERGLVRDEPPGPASMTPDYAGMSALVLAREMTWGPCLVPPLTSRDELPRATREFLWAPDRGTDVAFNLLEVCASHEVQVLSISYSAPKFVEVSRGFVSGSGARYNHGENYSKKEITEDHVHDLRNLLGLWSRFKSSDSEDLEMAINRLSSSIHRNRGRFWLQDRILDAAICLELMYQLEPPELANKLASRAAHLLATETNKRIEIYDQVHMFYEARSNIAHGDKGKRKRRRRKKATDFKKAADLGLTLATDTLRALLENGKFPTWKELILSP